MHFFRTPLAAVLLLLSFALAPGADDKTKAESNIIDRKGDDPALLKAYELARTNFRFFWREVSWEQRRIIPGLGVAHVKAPFSDGGDSKVEHMWITDIRFDGTTITGRLVNQPRALKSMKPGDDLTIKVEEISDWLYSLNDQAYGGWTVQAIRSSMKEAERKAHDEAWGIDFGDPKTVLLCPPFGEEGADGKRAFNLEDEHLMARNMLPKLKEFLESNPEEAKSKGDDGMTWLHRLSLNGSTSSVKMLLEHGADPAAKSKTGHTALELAEKAGWKETAEVLKKVAQ